MFGTLQSHHLQNSLRNAVDPAFAGQIGDGRGLLQEEVQKRIPPEALHNLLGGLADSISFVFQWSVLLGILGFICILFMGRARLEIPAAAGQGAGRRWPGRGRT
ncbi:hypothetical protein N6H14_18220 [Paenibacillus sp. CC-CFT747]|nr:hypothetical protein N6H14_18220 [Paenibacillus sp. CC-CFT747]